MNRLSIAIPASIISDIPHLREKTSRIGLVGRAAAIFRVNEVIVYLDNPLTNQAEDANLIATLLAYMETPQYLRKALFKLSPNLQYAGVLPPLRTAHHPLNRRSSDLKAGEYREGVIMSITRKGSLIDIGVERPALATNIQLPVGKRVTTRILKTGDLIDVELANRDQIPAYWGYLVNVQKRPLGESIKQGRFDLTIATSKHGEPFRLVIEQIAKEWVKADDILVAFGSPSAGLNEIIARERLCLNDLVDFTVNTLPMQGTETVRTEEALIATLACLNATFSGRASSKISSERVAENWKEKGKIP